MLKAGDKVRLVGHGFRYVAKCDVISQVDPCQGETGEGEGLYAQLAQNVYWVTDDPNSSYFYQWGVELMEEDTKAPDTEPLVSRFSVGDKVIVKSEANPVWEKFGIGEVTKIDSDGTTLDVAFRGDAVRETFSANYICGQFDAKNLWKLV